MSKEIFRASNITKTFPGVKALQNVNLTLETGSIHALLGENGAGKSTLIKIITGIHKPDSGYIALGDETLQLNGPRDAIAKGIGVVHQERNLISRFSISENIFLESLSARPLSPINYRELHRSQKMAQHAGARYRSCHRSRETRRGANAVGRDCKSPVS